MPANYFFICIRRVSLMLKVKMFRCIIHFNYSNMWVFLLNFLSFIGVDTLERTYWGVRTGFASWSGRPQFFTEEQKMPTHKTPNAPPSLNSTSRVYVLRPAQCGKLELEKIVLLWNSRHSTVYKRGEKVTIGHMPIRRVHVCVCCIHLTMPAPIVYYVSRFDNTG